MRNDENKIRMERFIRKLPSRLRGIPGPGDNPIKRPYPEHARDIEILAELLLEHGTELPHYIYSKRDLRLPFRPQGVLFIHALDIQGLGLSSNNFVEGSPFCVYVEVECQKTAKCSDPVYSVDKNKIRLDHSIHFSIELSEIRADEFNDLLIHIYAFQDPEVHYLIGSQVLHLYEFVREIHGITTVEMVNDMTFHVGKFTFEYAWSYGTYGYGFSNQFHNPKNPVLESVKHSMFPRIRLSPDDLVDNIFNSRVPKRLRLVTMSSLLVRQIQTVNGKKKVAGKGSSSKEFEAKPLIFRRAKFIKGRPVHVALNLDIHQKFMEDDFNQSYGEYLCLRNRKDRLQWLGQLNEGRLRDRMEYEAGELFIPIEDAQEARRILDTSRPLACPPGYLQQTKLPKPPCNPIKPDDVETKDIEFIRENLASAPRFSGYLSAVFGYAKPPEKEELLRSFEYSLPEYAGDPVKEQFQDNRTKIRKFFDRIVWFGYRAHQFWIDCYIFAFPELGYNNDAELPEISLTLPSPQHSTTDFHSYSTQRQLYENDTDFKFTKTKANIFLKMSRDVPDRDFDASDDEEGQAIFKFPDAGTIGANVKTKGGHQVKSTQVTNKQLSKGKKIKMGKKQ